MSDGHDLPTGGAPRDSGDSPDARLPETAEQLLDLARREPERLMEQVARLTVREQAELALRLPPTERMDLLLHAPRPMRLVRALPDADLYLTVREIGPTDAMPLLSLASSEQIGHLLDLESWRGDRFDAARCGAWIALLLESGEPCLKRFLRHASEEHLALLFRDWIRVEPLEYEDSPDVHGQGQSEAGSAYGFVTPDGYHRFSPLVPDHTPAIRRIMQIFFQDQPDFFQQVIRAALWELPAELEEMALKWRQSRLEEHGFPGWEEALGVYAPPAGSRCHPEPPEPTDRDGLPASRSLLPQLSGFGPLAAAFDGLTGEAREQALYGLVSLANHLLVADAADTGDPAAHRQAVRKAGGYLSIALAARDATDPAEASRVLEQVPVVELFREGHGQAALLQHRARQLVSEGWAAAHPDALDLLDAPLRQQIRGLLAARPLYVPLDDLPEGGTARDFASPREIADSRTALEMAEIVGGLLVDRLGLDVARALKPSAAPEAQPCRFSTILLTVLAWHATRRELRGDPLPGDVVADFLRTVASRRTADPEAPSRALNGLISALTDAHGLAPRDSAVLASFGRYCLEQLAGECGSLDPGVPVDRRYLACLLIADTPPAARPDDRHSR